MAKTAILGVPRTAVPAIWLPESDAVALDEAELIQWLDKAPLVWLPRALAEQDPSHKQLIPYLLVSHQGRLAAYRRGGAEQRLHGHWSLGIGGHIDATDAADRPFAILLSAARRELAEELPGLPPEAGLQLLGLINEDETPVGRVHLGLVFLIDAQTPIPPAGGDELHELSWLDVDAVEALPLERWSWLALRLWERARQ